MTVSSNAELVSPFRRLHDADPRSQPRVSLEL